MKRFDCERFFGPPTDEEAKFPDAVRIHAVPVFFQHGDSKEKRLHRHAHCRSGKVPKLVQ